jgi:hypothetical protein
MSWEERIEAARPATEARAKGGYIGADSIMGFEGEFATVEVNGVRVDIGMGEQIVSGEIVMSRESIGYAIWALAKSIGIDEQAEAMLKAAGVKF